MEKAIDTVQLQVNGVNYSISNPNAKATLNEWLRSQYGLKGFHIQIIFNLYIIFNLSSWHMERL